MSKVKEIIDLITRDKLDESKTLELLSKVNTLDRIDKNLIYLYTHPRILLDRELPIRIQNYREKTGKSKEGILMPDKDESLFLVEAYKTPQYHRFMLHLFSAFGNKLPTNPNELKVYKLDYNVDDCECPICEKKLVGEYELDKLDENKNPELYTAYTSMKSSICMCMGCLLNLFTAGEILSEIEPGYLYDPTKTN